MSVCSKPQSRYTRIILVNNIIFKITFLRVAAAQYHVFDIRGHTKQVNGIKIQPNKLKLMKKSISIKCQYTEPIYIY